MNAEQRPIVVGVDGSETSLAACRWAASEASRRGNPIRLVHAYLGPMLVMPMMAPPYDWLPDQLRDAADQLVERAEAEVRAVAPEVEVTRQTVAGLAGQVLSEQSTSAELVVVGHRGHGGFSSLLLGSVAQTVAVHARSSVAVVRPAPAADGPVLVGVDGSPGAVRALRLGFQTAELRGVAVQAVHVYQSAGGGWGHQPEPAALEAARAQLHEWVQPVWDEFPLVKVEHLVLHGQPAGQLIKAEDGTQLLVVGSRGRGGFAGMLLGSVSQQLVRHANGTLLIAR